MKKGIVSVLLYLLTIVVLVMMAAEGIFIPGVISVVATVIVFSLAFFLNNLTLKDKPRVHDSFNNPDHSIHIIAPICFLAFAFIPRIVWFFWPEVGTLLISTAEPSFASGAVIMLSFELGGIFSYLKLETSGNKISSEE